LIQPSFGERYLSTPLFQEGWRLIVKKY
jgi:hypothetical protein